MSSPPPPTDAAPIDAQAGGPDGSDRSTTRSLVAPIVVLVVVALLAIAAMTGGSGTSAPDTPAAEDGDQALPDDLATGEDGGLADPDELAADMAEQQQVEEEARQALDALATREADDPRALGDVDAPVVMVQWADFLCPFCGVFARDTEPELIERYVTAGLLRIEWRDLPFQGEEAFLAALGGQAAANQDAFWEYHERMFAADLRRGDGRLDRGFILEVAAELGLDLDVFEADLDDPVSEERVQGEAVLAQSIGISGTPAFIIGGYPTVGAQPLETFVGLIELAAADAGAELP